MGHARLSILDCTPSGRQPMATADGALVMAFNGEVYNHQEIRRELESAGFVTGWRGRSDTETLLEAIRAWGVAAALSRAVGMFALALWNDRTRELTLARDRFGEKPLYYGWINGAFVFASELKAIRCLASELPLCQEGLACYLQLGYVPAPLSVYEGVSKLEPGGIASVLPTCHGSVSLSRYWAASDAITRAANNPFAGSEVEAVEVLNELLCNAVRMQQIADVPVGVFLSGGIDSSLIAACAATESVDRLLTLTMGSSDPRFDESRSARAIAHNLGTRHIEEEATAGAALSLIPTLMDVYDEPFADYSQIPTILVSRLARRHVSVCLSGDGGDELFGGYNRYVWGKRLACLPSPAQRLLVGGAKRIRPGAWDRLNQCAQPVLPRGWRIRLLGDKMQKLARVLECKTSAERYQALVSSPIALVSGAHSSVAAERIRACWNSLAFGVGDVQRMMGVDTLMYLPDDILCKVDRASMSASLETRSPFLDHRVAEFAFSLPLSMKISGGKGKHILRRLLGEKVPRPLWDRPKTGFGIPLGDWLRGPLRDWADALLVQQFGGELGMLDGAAIRSCWQDHLAGRADRTRELWTVLMLRQWMTHWT
jgi:asparagine synthase (glutamine-hydrolysing)